CHSGSIAVPEIQSHAAFHDPAIAFHDQHSCHEAVSSNKLPQPDSRDVVRFRDLPNPGFKRCLERRTALIFHIAAQSIAARISFWVRCLRLPVACSSRLGDVIPRRTACCTAISICSDPVPQSAASTIVRSTDVTRIPSRVTTSAGTNARVVVWIFSPGSFGRFRFERGTVRWTAFGITSLRSCKSSALSWDTTATYSPTASHAATTSSRGYDG